MDNGQRPLKIPDNARHHHYRRHHHLLLHRMVKNKNKKVSRTNKAHWRLAVALKAYGN